MRSSIVQSEHKLNESRPLLAREGFTQLLFDDGDDSYDDDTKDDESYDDTNGGDSYDDTKNNGSNGDINGDDSYDDTKRNENRDDIKSDDSKIMMAHKHRKSTVISVMQRPNFYREYATPIFDSSFLLVLS